MSTMAAYDRVLTEHAKQESRSTGTLQDQGFRFVCIDGECDWKHPAEIPANAVDCTDMDDDEFADFMFFGTEPGDCFVAEEDREPPTKVGLGEDIPGERYFAGIAMPNPISQRDEE